ncbi:MAG: prolyl oligopeptidase family serine peptidase [Alphaproteobacteria bacterium]|jgi:fermentation-respiration switch protein FrsA (DUF1100 family)|nr:prolyl oligopeptidase family serine peptidase [Alphaproteobacteria bacterium]
MAGWILIALLGYGAVVGVMYVAQRSFIYFPSSTQPVPRDYDAADFEVVDYRSEDGITLSGWYKPSLFSRPTIAYFHGNAGHIGQRVDKVRAYTEQGYGVFLAGYRGYGGNPGRPTEAGLFADARAALDWLDAQGISGQHLFLYGESLGSGVAVQMAVERRIGGLILEAPFSSVADIAQSRYRILPARWLLHDHFDSAAKIAEIDAPLLLVHGDRDFTVPIRFGRRLFDAAVEPKRAVYIPGAGHNDLYDHGMAERVLAFLGNPTAQTVP